MTASLFDNPLYHRLFDAGEAARLFTAGAEVRAMLLVEGTLAKVQGAAGIIPELSAAAIHRATLEITLDPGGLAAATGENGVPVPGLVAAFRKEMQAPEHAQYLHWGATSQDIVDTGLMLRLRRLLDLVETAAKDILRALATLAEDHADLPMPARTWGQHATPTSFGAVTAAWGAPLLDLLRALPALRQDALLVSLSGAAGTAAELGPDPAALRADLAAALGLADPGRSWHADRTPILRIAGWLSRLATALGRMGEDLVLLTQTGIEEVTLGASGASSTMPQKQNPVVPSALSALARQTQAQHAALEAAALHRQQRDGAAWFAEWLALPPLCLAAAAAAETARRLVPGLAPNPVRMAEALASSGGLIHAEALSFHLARHMPRPEAQGAVKALASRARTENRPLADLAAEAHPELDTAAIFDPARQLGTAPAEARRFAADVRSL